MFCPAKCVAQNTSEPPTHAVSIYRIGLGPDGPCSLRLSHHGNQLRKIQMESWNLVWNWCFDNNIIPLASANNHRLSIWWVSKMGHWGMCFIYFCSDSCLNEDKWLVQDCLAGDKKGRCKARGWENHWYVPPWCVEYRRVVTQIKMDLVWVRLRRERHFKTYSSVATTRNAATEKMAVPIPSSFSYCRNWMQPFVNS